MFRATFYALVFGTIANPLLADEVTDTLSSALEAYNEGDISYALEELDYARQLLQEMTTQELAVFLPEAPAGWTREMSDSEITAGLAMMGGGSGVSAEYTDGNETVEISLIADSPMISMFSGMLANAGMMGLKLHRVGREKFVESDGDLSAVIDNRILVQASGGSPEVMIPLLKMIDFKALKNFDK